MDNSRANSEFLKNNILSLPFLKVFIEPSFILEDNVACKY